MNKIVLITGASSGIGKECAIQYAKLGYIVIATMRRPKEMKEFLEYSSIHILPLDVTKEEQIEACFQYIKERYNRLDILVNNAGYGLFGIFEEATHEQIKEQFETNVFGVISCTQKAIRLMRPQNSGSIVTVSSIAGRVGFPYYTLYNGSKYAIEGIMESLRFEVAPFGIQIKVIEPGTIKTDFFTRSKIETSKHVDYDEHQSYFLSIQERFQKNSGTPHQVAAEIVKASRSSSTKLRYPVTPAAKALLLAQKITPSRIFDFIVREVYKKR